MKFTVDPIRDGKYVLTKLKIFNGMNKTTFTDDQVPMERNCYVCIAAIDVDSVLKIDKKVYPQEVQIKKKKACKFYLA